MSKKYISKNSHTDWRRIDSMTDEEIDFSDIPEITPEKISGAKLRLGGKSVMNNRVRINLLLDSEIVAYFKMIGGDKEYRKLINEALKASIHQQVAAQFG